MKSYNIIYLGSGHCPVVDTVRAKSKDEAIYKAGYDFDDYIATESSDTYGFGDRFIPDEDDLMTW